MGFQSMKTYDEERFKNLFTLRNDGEYADVIFMYESDDDVLMTEAHYLKSQDYSGYVHCNKRGCPVCAKGIRIQKKLFIPVYNIAAGEIQFWDRTVRFDNQLEEDVFKNYSNPSEFVFRISRHGVHGDRNTTYSIMAIGKNSDPNLTVSAILKKFGKKSPDYYSAICREFSNQELSEMLSVAGDNRSYDDPIPDYQVSSRVSTVEDTDVTDEDLPFTPTPEIYKTNIEKLDKILDTSDDNEPLDESELKF